MRRGRNRSTKRLAGLLACSMLAPSVRAGETTPKGQDTGTVYAVSGDAITRVNGDRVNNRPLYCHHQPALAMVGDRPFIVFASQPYICGAFMTAVVRQDRGRWLHQFSEVRMFYRPGRVEWQLSDGAFDGLTAIMEAVTTAETPGFTVRLEVRGVQPGDRFVGDRNYGSCLDRGETGLPPKGGSRGDPPLGEHEPER